MAGRGFLASRELGGRAEGLVGDLFAGAGVRCERAPSGDHPGFDLRLRLGRRELTAEVKYDALAARTGNLALEYYNVRSGKPSGILATSADVWLYVLDPRPGEAGDGPRVWLARSGALKTWFWRAKYHRRVTRCGDGNAAVMLFRADELLPRVFTRVDDRRPDELRRLLASVHDERGPARAPA